MSDTQNSIKSHKRPLSPHLQVYRLPPSAITSISHRASGVVLSLGTILVTAWLVAAATGEEAFNIFMDIARTPLGLFVLFGWSLALFYHLCSGIRHLLMDIGLGFKETSINKTVFAVFGAAFALTIIVWAAGFSVSLAQDDTKEIYKIEVIDG